MIHRLRLLIKLLGFVIILVWHFVWLMIVTALSGKKTKTLFYIRRSFCKSALSVLNIKVNVQGNRNVTHGLVISNHRSLLDPLVELSILDVYILSKAEVGTYPLIGKGAKETGVFFVDRNSDQSRKSALMAIEQLLKSGLPVLIYPEGTTHGADLTSDFRKGSFEIAFNHQIPVIPLMIEYPNAEYYWTDSTLMEYFKNIFSKPGKHKVDVTIGDAIFASTKEDLVATTKATIDNMIIQTRKSKR